MSQQRRLHSVMLLQPNYTWLGKRTWKLIPYGLGLINACLKQAGYRSWIFDPNFDDLTEEDVRAELRRTRPDVVGITSSSTEYVQEPRLVSRIIREELPETTIVLGGVLPTLVLEQAAEDANVDYFVLGEGEVRMVQLLDALNSGGDLSAIDGVAYGTPLTVQPPVSFISDLDAIPLPDYGGLDFLRYAHQPSRYAHHFHPRQFPFAATVTSRGCPYHCIFCAGHLLTGRKIRVRSAASVLAEIDSLVEHYGIREVIFLDDHFLADRPRVVDILGGLLERRYDLMWKCANLNVMSLDDELLDLMHNTGCYQMTISVESGNPHVLKDIVKKPFDLAKVPGIVDAAKARGFEIAANFIIGFPGETWDEIRDTFRYAEALHADEVNFHIATPLPKTELLEICAREGYIKHGQGEQQFGYTTGLVETPEFKPVELQTLRAYEWDRINFSSPTRKATIARMEGITLQELEEWRVRTRANLGTTIGWKE